MKTIFAVLLLCICSLAQSVTTISPNTASIFASQTQQFVISEDNVDNPNGSWAAGCGSINANGLFTGQQVQIVTPCIVSFTNNLTGQVTTAVVTLNPDHDHTAELPRQYVNSSVSNTPTPGVVTQVPLNSLQLAVNNANCGDVLLLQAGSTYTGNVTYPYKACDDGHWIQIRTSAPDTVLPSEGTEITPCYAGVASLPGRPALNCANTTNVMTRLMAVKSGGPITLASGANHYRFGPGIEITRPVGTGVNYILIAKDANVPADHIIIDRDWVHGTVQDETTRGINLSGIIYAGVVDSYFNDFHCTAGIGTCVDAQAIAGGSGSLQAGVWKIDHNFLEASAENILFGGTLNNSTTPSDIQITRNHLFKPLIWMFGQPGFVGQPNTTGTGGCKNFQPLGGGQCPFTVKNLFELKNAQRVQFEGNVLDYVWAGFSQHGGAILIEGANNCATPTNSTVSVADVTIRFNYISHAASPLALTNPSGGTSTPNCPIYNISAHDNVFADINADMYGDSTGTWDFETTDCPTCIPWHDFYVGHNTMIVTSKKKMLIAVGSTFAGRQGFTFSDNIAVVNAGVTVGGDGYPAGTPLTNLARLNYLFNNPIFAGNVLIGGTGIWPSGNYFPATTALVQFNPDYSLADTSPYKGKASDGTGDPGANVAVVLTATAGTAK